MQSPVRLYLAACADVTRDVVRSTAGRVCVHGHLEIGCVFIGRASGGKHAGNAHPRSGDGPVRRNPRLGRNRTHDGAARRGKIRVQLARAAAERRRVSTGGDVLTRDFAEQSIGRRGHRGAERSIRDYASGLRRRTTERYMFERAA